MQAASTLTVAGFIQEASPDYFVEVLKEHVVGTNAELTATEWNLGVRIAPCLQKQLHVAPARVIAVQALLDRKLPPGPSPLQNKKGLS